jgi:hypothetical protein
MSGGGAGGGEGDKHVTCEQGCGGHHVMLDRGGKTKQNIRVLKKKSIYWLSLNSRFPACAETLTVHLKAVGDAGFEPGPPPHPVRFTCQFFLYNNQINKHCLSKLCDEESIDKIIMKTSAVLSQF